MSGSLRIPLRKGETHKRLSRKLFILKSANSTLTVANTDDWLNSQIVMPFFLLIYL